jgi:hypothetical protein
MTRNRLLFLVFLFLLLPTGLWAQDHRCSICHGKKEFGTRDASGKFRSLHVDQEAMTNSAHGRLPCVDCHLDVLEIPHQKKLKRVNCIGCHDRGRTFEQGPTMEYSLFRDSIHGREREKGNQKAPDCASCHGSHDVLSHLDIRSRGYRLNIEVAQHIV